LLTGFLTGAALGLASTRYLASMLYQVNGSDTVQLAVPCLIIFSTAVIAALPPVLRALRINPVDLLRAQ
jgi:ABC-type antimicrobial peptide transport system permease subunit